MDKRQNVTLCEDCIRCHLIKYNRFAHTRNGKIIAGVPYSGDLRYFSLVERLSFYQWPV